MTSTLNNVPRELLERLRSYIPNGDGHNSQYANDLADAVVALEGFAAPSPAGVDGLEVVQAVAWLNTATKEATTHPVVVMDWDDEKEPVESLMPISQHEAIIDGLRGEVEGGRRSFEIATGSVRALISERDQQAKRIGELEGLLRECFSEFDTSEASDFEIDMRQRIDAALSAGKEGV